MMHSLLLAQSLVGYGLARVKPTRGLGGVPDRKPMDRMDGTETRRSVQCAAKVVFVVAVARLDCRWCWCWVVRDGSAIQCLNLKIQKWRRLDFPADEPTCTHAGRRGPRQIPQRASKISGDCRPDSPPAAQPPGASTSFRSPPSWDQANDNAFWVECQTRLSDCLAHDYGFRSVPDINASRPGPLEASSSSMTYHPAFTTFHPRQLHCRLNRFILIHLISNRSHGLLTGVMPETQQDNPRHPRRQEEE